MALLVTRWTNDRKVAGSRPTKVVCITVLTGYRMGVNKRRILANVTNVGHLTQF